MINVYKTKYYQITTESISQKSNISFIRKAITEIHSCLNQNTKDTEILNCFNDFRIEKRRNSSFVIQF